MHDSLKALIAVLAVIAAGSLLVYAESGPLIDLTGNRDSVAQPNDG